MAIATGIKAPGTKPSCGVTPVSPSGMAAGGPCGVTAIRSFWLQPVDEEVSTSITQTWTDQAIKCYVTQADCANCTIPKGNYSFICQMNKVVPVLLRTLGAPDSKRVNKLLPYLSQY